MITYFNNNIRYRCSAYPELFFKRRKRFSVGQETKGYGKTFTWPYRCSHHRVLPYETVLNFVQEFVKFMRRHAEILWVLSFVFSTKLLNELAVRSSFSPLQPISRPNNSLFLLTFLSSSSQSTPSIKSSKLTKFWRRHRQSLSAAIFAYIAGRALLGYADVASRVAWKTVSCNICMLPSSFCTMLRKKLTRVT